jgi:hypothetical protein
MVLFGPILAPKYEVPIDKVLLGKEVRQKDTD